MKLHELRYNEGSIKDAKRVGRGTSSDRGDSGATSRIYRRDRGRTDSLGHYGDSADREDT